MQNFADTLKSAVKRCGNPVLVGLDPQANQLPNSIQRDVDLQNPVATAHAYRVFCQAVIDVVAPLVSAVKPQAAFFEQLGPAGMQSLQDVIQYAKHQELVVLLDGKRNDIGSTATAYADAYLGIESVWRADALTVSPYLGNDSLTPFVDVAKKRGCGVFVLVKTSNPGGGQFQDLNCDGQPMFYRVADYVETLAQESQGECGYGSVGAVVGATYPEQLTLTRQRMPHTWFLVPGFGAQGGTAKDAAGAFDESGFGALVNSSRGIIFAHNRKEYRQRFSEGNWQDAVNAATRDMIAVIRSETTVGRLPAYD